MFDELYRSKQQFLHYEATRLPSLEKQGEGALENFKIRLWMNKGEKLAYQISLLFSGNVVDIGILFGGALVSAARINLYQKPLSGSLTLCIGKTLQLEGFGFYDGTIFLKYAQTLH